MDRCKVLNMKDPPNSSWDRVINAAIMAGQGFFFTLAGIGAAQLTSDPIKSLVAAVVVAGLEFFTTLAVQKKLIKKPEE